ncbi:hypothetical protein Cgig2_021103 [Carnegiea gigantea]|uniref:Endonuclease/exonuclease/phosphatase domain-containing protein n=1 Tax=Carnegiea gigantea TaxID=171969 RepID=A0A9Q1K293_9CARY|nr:hypothetical protein Cgig2_021103 [Carnegiea gigantea]
MEQSGNKGSGELNTPEQTEAPISEVVHPTYVSLLDADEGTLLSYKPATIVNGKKCAQIEIKDVAPEVDYWQHAILCSVLGANPPYEVIKGFVQRIWADFEIDKILMVRKGLFLVRFVQLQDKLTPFIVKGWNPDMDINTESIQFLPLWVQFPELYIKYWGLDSLSKLGSLIGIPLKKDRYTKEKTMIKYAQLLIEVPMAGPFPDFIEFFNEHGELIRQSIKFEWKPSKCNHCGMYGHLEEESAEDGNYITVTRKAAANWNVRGLNWPNKQEDLKLFLYANKVGLISLLESKIKLHKVTDQLVHGEAIQYNSNKRFYITMVYGMNQASQRKELWDDLQNLAPRSEAWCIMRDFNAVLRWEDRIGGDILMELKPLLEACELHELHTMGPYYTWTNKTVWSRLDRVLLNAYWYAGFDYMYARNMPMGLSDHTPILMQFIDTPRPQPSFQYCEMSLPNLAIGSLAGLYLYLDQVRVQLKGLNKTKFADLQGQQLKARQGLERIQLDVQLHPMDPHLLSLERQAREHYITILSSSRSLI